MGSCMTQGGVIHNKEEDFSSSSEKSFLDMRNGTGHKTALRHFHPPPEEERVLLIATD